MANVPNPDLVTIALERVEGTAFEKFVNASYPTVRAGKVVFKV